MVKFKKTSPFAVGTPSVFVVWSPFQILCAVSAIRQLDIKEYLVIVYLPKGGARNKQIINTLEFFEISYKTILDFNRFRYYIRLFLAVFPYKRQFSRLFIGDYRDFHEHIVGFGYITNGADVIYLDDGNPSIRLFQNKYDYKSNRILNAISKFRGLELFYNMLTIYLGIPNEVFNIKKLSFENIINKQDIIQYSSDAIVIVGTYIDSYCEALCLMQDQFIKKIDQLCREIRSFYKEKNIYYFPHGSETQNYDELICRKYQIHFHRCSKLIELELQDMGIYPSVVYGFTSNALFTIKNIYPDSKVVNLVFEIENPNSKMAEYIEISKYYSLNNIDCKLLTIF